MPDLKTFVNGAEADAAHIAAFQTAMQSDLSSHARHALDGCLFGLAPNTAQTHVQVGEAYVAGNRLRLRADEAIDLAGITRPTGTMVAWVTVLASYATANSLTVTDDQGVQYTLCIDDSIIVSLSRGANAANEAAAVKPTPPTGSIVLCDILLDRTTAVGSLTGDPSRRPKCPDDELREEDDKIWDALRAVQDTLAAGLQAPEKGPTPAATSTTALQVDATWAAGTVPSGAPAINGSKFRWSAVGENFNDARTITLGNIRAYSFDVPDADSAIRMQVQYGNSNGFGPWSDEGTIAAADIEAAPALVARTFTADDSFTWPYPQSTRARVEMHGGAGGGGGGAGGGGSGGGGHHGGGGGGAGANGGGGGGAVAENGSMRDGEDSGGGGGEGSQSRTSGGDGGAGAGNGTSGEDGDDQNTGDGGDGGDGGASSGGGGGGAAGGNRGGDGGDGGDGGGTGGDGGAGGGGAGGGGAGGGNGGNGGSTSNFGGGGGGGGGSKGVDGTTSRVQIAARSIDVSATGGAGGGGGGAGGGGSEAGDGSTGDDGTSSGGGGAGGAGGSGGQGNGDGGAGGAGAAGVSGQPVISDISGLQVGDVFTITVGAGGAGGDGGGGGGGTANGSNGSDGSTGSAGSVTITPLTG